MLETISNGMGGQSMLLLWLACEGKLPARISITADTGSEEDNIMYDGSRITAAKFFYDHIKPMAERYGVQAYFVRSQFADGKPMPPLHIQMEQGGLKQQNVPLFGSEGGRLRQTCTDKWKMRAIRQQMRRLGVANGRCARSAVGLHLDEAVRRISGIPRSKLPYKDMKFQQYQTVNGSKPPKQIKWMYHYYPLIDMRMGRQAVRDKLAALGIPYLISSECDHCPHQDDARWLSKSQETIERIAKLEEVYEGEFFFTDRRIQLKMAIEEMRKNPKVYDPVFGCKNGLCGI